MGAYFLRALAFSVVLIVGVAPAAAQVAPGSGDTKPAPQKFVSPFNGERAANSNEEADFAELQALLKAAEDAETASQAAIKCDLYGPEAKRLWRIWVAANKAFRAARDEYIDHWSNILYSKPLKEGLPPEGSRDYEPYKADREKLIALLNKDRKPLPPTTVCPPKDGPAQPAAPRATGTPLPPCDDGSADAAITAAEADLARANTDRDRVKRVKARDDADSEKAQAELGPRDDKTKRLAKVVKADEEVLDNLSEKIARIEQKIKQLKALKACPAQTTPAPTPATPAPMPSCDDGSATDAMNALDDELAGKKKLLALIEVQLKREEQLLKDMRKREPFDNEKYQEAVKIHDDTYKTRDRIELEIDQIQKSIDQLKALTPCPPGQSVPPKPPKTDPTSTGGGLFDNVTIGIGIGIGGHREHDGHHDDDRPRDPEQH